MSSKAKIKGTRVENQIRDMHLAAGIPAKAYSIASFFRNITIDKKFDGCWLWEGAKVHNSIGYGSVTFQGEKKKAHRLMWELFFGPIPKGLCVCHSCDTPNCVSPQHLWVGTYTENNKDRHRKGRTKVPKLKGEEHPHAKLTVEDVREIRELYGNGWQQKEIANKFNSKQGNISRILAGKAWAHVE